MARRADPGEFVFVETLELGGRGPSVAVKDSIDIAGVRTRMGSACLAGAPPATQHAAVVRSLLAAGCRIVGKTNMHELARTGEDEALCALARLIAAQLPAAGKP